MLIASVALDDGFKIAGIILAIPVVTAIVWAVIKLVGFVGLLAEAITGRDETQFSEGIPSMKERFAEITAHLQRMDKTLGEVKAELTYNGGGTTKDQVRLVSRKVDELKIGQAQAIGREGTIAGTAVRTAAALHDETEQTAADVADTAVKVAEAVEAKRLPVKKATPRKRAAPKKAAAK